MEEEGRKHCHMENNKWWEVESVEDVLLDILSRLPVDCLLEFKLVCKYWHRLITSQTFIDMQLRRSREEPIFLLYPCVDNTMTSYLVKSDGQEVKEIAFPIHGNPSYRTMVCSVDGLIGCLNHPWDTESDDIDPSIPDFEIRVYNPATGEVLLLPKGSPSEEMPSIGFALGPKINDYKVYRFFHAKDESEAIHPECEVFSSSTGSWKVIGKVPHVPMRSCYVPLGFEHVCLDGKVFWFIVSEDDRTIPCAILTVDAEENFGTISLPMEPTIQSFLIVLEGCLSLVIVDEEAVYIWLLKDCNGSKWVDRFSDYFPFSEIDFVHSVAVRKNEIFFMTSDPSYILNLDDGSWKEFHFGDPDEKNFPVAFAYTESLLSCWGRFTVQRE